MSSQPSFRNATGGCHCGQVRYTVKLDLSNLQPSKCNCSYCHKSNYVAIEVKGDGPEHFQLHSPPSISDQGNYIFNKGKTNHYFCKNCGIVTMMKGEYGIPKPDGEEVIVPFFHINGTTLDQVQEGLDLTEMKFIYWNGMEDDWLSGPKDKPASWGSW